MEKTLKQHPGTCLKVVLFGPESTGKTTLCRALAEQYETQWVPEFARDYLQKKWDVSGQICAYEDILPIAKGQMKLENNATASVTKILFCDTDLLETRVYSEIYFQGRVPEEVRKFSIENTYDLYLLTYIDTPWTPDDLRDKPNEREPMFAAFQNMLLQYQRPFIIIRGNHKNRMQQATKAIDHLIQSKSDYDRY